MKLEEACNQRSAQEVGSEFDDYADAYEDLLRDPLRSAFTSKGSQFFHTRKRDVLLAFFRRKQIDTSALFHLDVGCGKGELLSLLRSEFKHCAGCDPSLHMMASIEGIETRWQNGCSIPYESESFDFVTAVCVYHHVAPAARSAITKEVRRVLKPNGYFAIIEHNPLNPITRIIVRRAPVDADAILLRASEVSDLMESAGFCIGAPEYFLYVPERLYRIVPQLEQRLSKVPFGGQYAIFGQVREDVRMEASK